MDLFKAKSIIDGYASWWKDNAFAYQEGESIRFVCPLLNRHNDHMSLYIAENSSDGGYLISDLGETLNDLKISGCDVLKSEVRTKKLEQTLCGFGIGLKDNELCVAADEGSLFQKMNMLMQGMASVDDLFFTAKDSVKSLFVDDIAKWLENKGIRFTKDARFSGRSGFETKFDFVIPSTPKIAPERLIKAVGSPSENSVKNALFGWSDISSVRGESSSYLFMNASNQEKNISTSLIQACRNYDVNPVIWDGNADSVLQELAA